MTSSIAAGYGCGPASRCCRETVAFARRKWTLLEASSASAQVLPLSTSCRPFSVNQNMGHCNNIHGHGLRYSRDMQTYRPTDF